MSTAWVQAQIAAAAQSLGIQPSVALALAQSESGFNTQASGDNGCSYGVFQLNTCAGHPAGLDVGGQITYALGLLQSALQQSGGNVTQAFAIYKGGSGGQNTAQAQAEATAAAAGIPSFAAYDSLASVTGGIGLPTSAYPSVGGPSTFTTGFQSVTEPLAPVTPAIPSDIDGTLVLLVGGVLLLVLLVTLFFPSTSRLAQVSPSGTLARVGEVAE